MSQPQRTQALQTASSQAESVCSFDFGLEPGNFFDKDLVNEYNSLTKPTSAGLNTVNEDAVACVDLKGGRRLSNWVNCDGESTEQQVFDSSSDSFLLKAAKRQKFFDRSADDFGENREKMDFYLRNSESSPNWGENRYSAAHMREKVAQSDNWKELNIDEAEEMRRKVRAYDESAESWRGEGVVRLEPLRSYAQGLYKCAALPPNALAQLYNNGSRKTLGGVVSQFRVPVAAATVVRSDGAAAAETRSSFDDSRDARHDSRISPPIQSTASTTCAESGAATNVKSTNDESTDLISIIEREILQVKGSVNWDDLCGLQQEKAAIKEMVVWPMLRPDLFKGIRAPPRGLLLYGPPGTGKTLIGRCVASQCKATFFNVSASSLTSKWLGESEKLVRTLFQVARLRAPSVIFIDEIDSLMSQRLENEHEATRRIKNEFLQQLDGTASDSEDGILLIGATNRPQELDTAARRRFARRLYVPLPDRQSRLAILEKLLKEQKHDLSSEQLDQIAAETENYSCADVTNLCKEAALGPLRSVQNIETVTHDEIQPIMPQHFQWAISTVRPTVSEKDVAEMKRFHSDYGYNKI